MANSTVESGILIRAHLRSWSWSFAGQGLQLAAQAGSFLLLAKSLPVKDLGTWVGVGALASILSPFAAMGTANVLIKHVSRDPAELPKRWQQAVSTSFWCGLALCCIASLACRLLLPDTASFYVIVGLFVAELLVWRWTQLVGLTLQGLHQVDRKSQLDILVVAARAGAALLLFSLPVGIRNLGTWLAIYLGTGLLVSCLCLWRAVGIFGKASLRSMPRREDLREGLGFVLSPLAQTVNNDADKFLLARLANLGSAAVYGTAYRILFAAFMPVQALLTVTYPRFFRHGKQGIKAALRYAAAWLPGALAYSLIAGGALFAAAPAIARLLGPGYADTVVIVRSLAVLPLLKAVQLFFGDSLTGADQQNLRVGMQGLIAVLNVILNLLLIPRYGWRGTVIATLISDTALAFLLAVCVVKLSKSEKPVPQDQES